jgi:Holliday junction resolvase RusA-like endonuclease
VRVVIPKAMLVSENDRIGGKVNGRFILSKNYRDKKRLLARFLAVSLAKEDLIEGPVRVRGTVHWPDNHRRDLTMFLKVLHDALNGVAYTDDSQIWDFHYTRGANDAANPRLELVVEPMPVSP